MKEGVYSSNETVLADFPSQTEAENAISELRGAGSWSSPWIPIFWSTKSAILIQRYCLEHG